MRSKFRLNKEMTIGEFKKIFYMEWAHRIWGRAIGVFFLVPAVYFARKGYLKGEIGKRVLGIGTLIGFQVILLYVMNLGCSWLVYGKKWTR